MRLSFLLGRVVGGGIIVLVHRIFSRALAGDTHIVRVVLVFKIRIRSRRIHLGKFDRHIGFESTFRTFELLSLGVSNMAPLHPLIHHLVTRAIDAALGGNRRSLDLVCFAFLLDLFIPVIFDNILDIRVDGGEGIFAVGPLVFATADAFAAVFDAQFAGFAHEVLLELEFRGVLHETVFLALLAKSTLVNVILNLREPGQHLRTYRKSK